MRSVPAVVAFNAGEIGPTLHGRVDLAKYGAGCRSLENMLVQAEGPVTRRPGLRFIAASKAHGVARLIPFEFSTTQAYVIEAGEGYFRFYKDGGQITSGGLPYEIATPYALADLPLLRWVQSADTLYMAHPGHAPRKLTRSGHTAWSLTTIGFTATPAEWAGSNWPGTVAFYEERLVWAGTPGQPQTVWASRTGDFENLTTGAAADDALKFTIVDGSMNAIRWISAQRVLLAGTASGEFSVSSASSSGALTPTDAKARRQTTVGSATVAPIAVGNAVLYVQRAGRALMEIAYRNDQDAYASPELSTLARHITRPGIAEMAWQAEPWRVLWCALVDGQLVGLTYMRDQEVVAWHRHPIGGTDAKALSVAVIPSATATELWVLVERTIGGATARHVERLDPEFYRTAGTAEAFFVDAGLTYAGAPADVIGGLEHLIGETVQILADGAAHPDRVVAAGGTVTLQQAASRVHVGLGYHAEVEPLDIQSGAQDGANLSRMKRVHAAAVLLHQTLGARVGYRDAESGGLTLETVEFRRPSDPMDAAPALFTGTHLLTFPPHWQRAASVVVTQDQPLPLTVLGIVPRMTTND